MDNPVATTKKKSVDLEKSMQDLEKVVEQLESGDLSLDKSLQQFEKGVKLSRDCQAALTDAEQKVQVLLDSGLKDIDPEDLNGQ
ncbi:MAG: exodeoxyribonuclease VII small subunit [Chromatiales bacterium]|jgi:exodeoxyribonuclease VII small subunit|nr:exodeoxyribonuclease VII small subunit [Chromatiales bacterium]